MPAVVLSNSQCTPCMRGGSCKQDLLSLWCSAQRACGCCQHQRGVHHVAATPKSNMVSAHWFLSMVQSTVLSGLAPTQPQMRHARAASSTVPACAAKPRMQWWQHCASSTATKGNAQMPAPVAQAPACYALGTHAWSLDAGHTSGGRGMDGLDSVLCYTVTTHLHRVWCRQQLPFVIRPDHEADILASGQGGVARIPAIAMPSPGHRVQKGMLWPTKSSTYCNATATIQSIYCSTTAHAHTRWPQHPDWPGSTPSPLGTVGFQLQVEEIADAGPGKAGIQGLENTEKTQVLATATSSTKWSGCCKARCQHCASQRL